MSKKKQVVHLIAAGDLLIHDACIASALNSNKGIYDFKPMLSGIKHIIKPADIAICNLETTISGKENGYSGYPRFNAPEELLEAIHETGFTVASTANNHSVDFGEQGILSTISALERNSLLHTGTSKSNVPSERNLIIDIQNIKIGVNSYTYGTNENPIPVERPWLINLINFDLIESDIKYMRSRGVEIVVVCLHAGEEYLTIPDATQISYVKNLRSLGVDIILGNHPHIVQPAMIDPDRKKYTIFSIGNLLSNQRESFRDTGVIVDIEIIKENNSVSLGTITYHPTYVYRWKENGKFHFRVIALDEYLSKGNQLNDLPFEKAELLRQHIQEHLNSPVELDK
jgi:poly-gamma-glutamate capsule biosynthesis protein CapA/YwtB (metallophosphatase superfamily)